jgi:carboxylesterase type B
MLAHRKVGIAQSFSKSIKKSLAHRPLHAKTLLQAYGITPNLPDQIALHSILAFGTDIEFFAPAISLAKGWRGNAYVYHFNEPNPWDGEWKGEATHILDVAFLFQNYNEFLPPSQKDMAVKFASDFIQFVNGEAPWAVFETDNQGAMVYGPSLERISAVWSSYVEGKPKQQSGRTSTIFKLGEGIPLDELSAAWGDFLAGE